MEAKNSQKKEKLFCNVCHYKSIRKSDYKKHLSTVKHKNNTNRSIKEELEDKKTVFIANNTTPFVCMCSKSFKTHGGLWKHKQKCKPKEEVQQKIPIISQEMVMEILKQIDELKNLLVVQNNQMVEQSKEFKGMIMEICKNVADRGTV